MHVDWNWIKQRPHFLYEELTQYYKVDLFYIKKLYISSKKKHIKNKRQTYSLSNVIRILKLPLSGRFNILRMVERFLNFRISFRLRNYDYIWITSPILLDFIDLKLFENKKVIYDCMDDFLAFYYDDEKIKRMKLLEEELIERADFIIASSLHLKETIISRYRVNKTIYLINNGISDSLLKKECTLSLSPNLLNTSSNHINLMYIGTIGDWLDFDIILRLLGDFPNVVFHLIGPVETKVPSHIRIKIVGVVPHEDLYQFAQQADGLVMPFQLNDLVLSVDPVKIYEYIFFNKPIFSVNYKEMHKFLPYVNLYSNYDMFSGYISDLVHGSMVNHSDIETRAFLWKHTWQERARAIKLIVKETS